MIRDPVFDVWSLMFDVSLKTQNPKLERSERLRFDVDLLRTQNPKLKT